MKKAISLLLCISFMAGALVACQKPSSDPADTRTDHTADSSAPETEPPFVLETEDEEPSEEIVYPYDNTHAYIFAASDKKSVWTSVDVNLTNEFNLLRLQPIGNDPIMRLDFVPEEQFSADEYPYVAYRYKATTTVPAGIFYVASTDYPTMTDAGLTWFSVNTQGEWTNLIVNMKEQNAYWSGQITAFRIDPINDMDTDAEIYLDRVGFFKTEKDAQAFLNAAYEVDHTTAYHLSNGVSDVLVPAGVASYGDMSADYLPADASLAPVKNGVIPLIGVRHGDQVSIVPVSYVNSVGYINYMAEAKGEYVLYYPEKNPVTDAEFVKVRGILTDAMLDDEKVTRETVWSALRNTLPDRVDQSASDWAASLGLDTSDPQKAATATDISKAVYAYLSHLGVEVYVDPDYYPAPNAIKAIKVATGSGIITDIRAASLSGEELAGVMTRLVKAMLGQPVLPSKVEDNGIKIGGWSYIDWYNIDENMKAAADCGINFLVTTPSNANRRQLLYSGMKYGVQTLIYDYILWTYDAEHPAPFPAASYKYYEFDSYMGNLIADEPGSDSFGTMALIADRYHTAFPDKLCYYNLLPMYANAAQLKYGANAAAIDYYDSDPDLYRKYVEAYARAVADDYICVDIYPLGSNRPNVKAVTYTDYMKNMDIFATVCREYDRDFWLYIQSFNFSDSSTWRADYNDVRFQMYVGLAFGVKTFIYFTFESYNTDDALLDNTGKPTALYYDAQKANREIMALSDDYMQYKNLGAFNMNCSKGMYRYARFDNQYTDFDILKEIKSDDALLFGCFEKEEGEGYAFSVVNLIDGVDRDRSEPATLTFTLEGEHTVSAWIKGEKVTLTPVNGAYTLQLDVAEGAFVIID
ncbi:MAG: hypothetical protein E7610_03365 [Ruminococcaceae bacterium]|nr:hypothetical protein [Oscillospiraceae bacterium]